MGTLLRVSPTWAREMLRAASFRVTEAVWWPDGTLVVHYFSAVPTSDWVLAALPQHLRIAGEEVDAKFTEQVPFITGSETALAIYQTAVRHSAPLRFKEGEPSAEHADVIVLEEVS